MVAVEDCEICREIPDSLVWDVVREAHKVPEDAIAKLKEIPGTRVVDGNDEDWDEECPICKRRYTCRSSYEWFYGGSETINVLIRVKDKVDA